MGSMAEESQGCATYEMQVEETLGLMQARLPEYAVNCFVDSGYDSLSAIALMDVSNQPNNSISVIEEYIGNTYGGDPRYLHDESTRSASLGKCIFPPGHRLLITAFVIEVKRLVANRSSRKRVRTESNQNQNPKRPCNSNEDHDTSGNDEPVSLST